MRTREAEVAAYMHAWRETEERLFAAGDVVLLSNMDGGFKSYEGTALVVARFSGFYGVVLANGERVTRHPDTMRLAWETFLGPRG
jgi:hypothetical protein